MSRRSWHQPDYVYLGLIAVLLVVGLVVLSSASSVLGFTQYGDSLHYLKKQVLALAIGIVAFLITFNIDYHVWRRWAVPIMMVTVILLLLVFVPGIGPALLGAHRWLVLGPILFQPSEVAKLSFIIYLAAWFERRDHIIGNFRQGLVPFLVALAVIGGLVLLQPDLGTTLIIILIAITLFFSAGGSIRHLAGLLLLGVVLGALAIKLAPYRAARFTVFLNPAADPQGIGYHIQQAWLAIGSGGWFGLGLGHSRQKFNYLPEPAGDSIFAIMAEELGFLFAIGFIITWLALTLRGLKLSRFAPDRFGQLVAIGITVWLAFQTFLNIGALSGLLPLTGIPLPLMSNGGSAMIVTLTAIGVLMNISRQTTRSARKL